MKLGGYFLLVKRLFINIFSSLPYCYKGMKLAILSNFLLEFFNVYMKNPPLFSTKNHLKFFALIKKHPVFRI